MRRNFVGKVRQNIGAAAVLSDAAAVAAAVVSVAGSHHTAGGNTVPAAWVGRTTARASRSHRRTIGGGSNSSRDA